MFKRLERHAARQGSVANDDDDLSVGLAHPFPRGKQPQPLRNRSRGMSVVEKIVVAFVPLGETRYSAAFSERREVFVATRQKFVGVALVAHIKDNRIFRA